MGNFRSILSVNLMYNLMTKILVDRLAKVSSELISPNQTTLTKGRNISDNTMLAEEMVYGFCRKIAPKRCLMDILSRLIEWKVCDKFFDTYKVNGATSISHLMYANE